MDIRPWYVITGGPCVGKTTLLSELRERGYETIPEAARAHIEDQLAQGRTLKEIRADEAAFQRALIPMKLRAEAEAPIDRPVFFDRGMHDSIVYYAHAGVTEDAELAKAVQGTTYRTAFLLDPLPFEVDEVRTENADEARSIHEALGEAYSRAGIPVIRVPVMSVGERADFILASL